VALFRQNSYHSFFKQCRINGGSFVPATEVCTEMWELTALCLPIAIRAPNQIVVDNTKSTEISK
jgi:hypothetical protein